MDFIKKYLYNWGLMFKLIKNGELYCPEYQEKKDILICIDKFISIEKRSKIFTESFTEKVKIIDASGMIIVPGFIDHHMHFLGG